MQVSGILRLRMAYGASKALLSAVELGVFTTLAEGPSDCADLSARLGLHPRGARDFFDTLVALHLLRRAQGRYSNTPEADAFLNQERPEYLGEMMDLTNTHLYPHWSALTTALRTGQQQGHSGQARLKGDFGSARQIAEQIPWSEYRSFVDICTGHGALPVLLARSHEHLMGIGFDHGGQRENFERNIQRHGLAKRLRFVAGDVSADPWPSADVVILGQVLWQWDLEQKHRLLRKAHHALTDEGALLVYEPLIDDERRHNISALLSSLTLLIETPGGFECTSGDCAAWIKETGFRDVKVQRLQGCESLVIGVK